MLECDMEELYLDKDIFKKNYMSRYLAQNTHDLINYRTPNFKTINRITITLIVLFGLHFNLLAQDFITTWRTAANNETVTIPIAVWETYSYTVDWGDGSTDNTLYTAPATHTFASPGDYQISISGQFPQIRFGGEQQLISIDQWGDMQWPPPDPFLGELFRDSLFIDFSSEDAIGPSLSLLRGALKPANGP